MWIQRQSLVLMLAISLALGGCSLFSKKKTDGSEIEAATAPSGVSLENGVRPLAPGGNGIESGKKRNDRGGALAEQPAPMVEAEPDIYSAPLQGLQTIYFSYDQSQLGMEAKGVVRRNYEWIKKNPNAKIQIEGHTDERGTTEYNLSLGERRARAVFEYLVSLGANPQQLMVVSMGEEHPAVQGNNDASWSQNRRVEFTQP